MSSERIRRSQWESPMKLEQLVHSVESGLTGLGRRLLEPSSHERIVEELHLLSAQLRVRREELRRSQHELAGLKRRLRDNPTVAALLHSRVESDLKNRRMEQAWCASLELDQLRQTLAQDQQMCPCVEQRCWSLHFLIRQLERRLERLHEQLERS
jgi:hypothetical protein